MKRTIIYLIAILVLLTACSTTKDDDSGILENADETGTSSSSVALDKQVTKSHENETSLESSTRIVEVEPEQAIFDDTDEFLTAIIDDDGNTIHNNYRLNNIDMYFVPVVIPDNYHLEYISVDDNHIVFVHQEGEEYDPVWERTFIFEWNKKLGPGSTELNITKRYSDDKRYELYNGYYIVKVARSGADTKEITEGDILNQNIYWEQDGYSFHAVVPAWFTHEDIEKYCVASMVNVVKE